MSGAAAEATRRIALASMAAAAMRRATPSALRSLLCRCDKLRSALSTAGQ